MRQESGNDGTAWFRPARRMVIFLCMLLLDVPVFGEQTTGNLIADGGMEEWRSVEPGKGEWDYFGVACKGIEFGRDEKQGILAPKILSQFYECKVFKPETGDVHSGHKALRLKGQFYLSGSGIADGYNTKEGDVYLVRYWVKGAGQTLMAIHVYGDGTSQILETKGKAEKDRWSLIEERVQVVGRAPTTIYPRLWASEEMLFDDVSIVRVLREDELTLVQVPADCQERVAFASEASGPIVVDGKLDEPAWSKAVQWAGFRPFQNQQALAAAPPKFRVLFDADNIYFGFEIPLNGCAQTLRELQSRPLMDGVGKPLAKTDAYSGRESMELFLQPPGQSQYWQFAASLDGYRYDGAGWMARGTGRGSRRSA